VAVAVAVAWCGFTVCSDKWLISGSWDASVKIWKVSADGTSHDSVLELFEHESPVVSVAINDACTYLAAGAEDGNLVVWAVNPRERESRVSFTKLVSTAGRRYLPSLARSLYHQHY
jgi:WD40 repeat protein